MYKWLSILQTHALLMWFSGWIIKTQCDNSGPLNCMCNPEKEREGERGGRKKRERKTERKKHIIREQKWLKSGRTKVPFTSLFIHPERIKAIDFSSIWIQNAGGQNTTWSCMWYFDLFPSLYFMVHLLSYHHTSLYFQIYMQVWMQLSMPGMGRASGKF